jgi:prepilin-type N-terminal cleavage/methylation domain-containing protein
MNKKGYTLVEFLVSVAILSFVLLAMYGVLQTGNTIYTRDTCLLDMQQQSRNAMDRIVRDVRSSLTLPSFLNGSGNTSTSITMSSPPSGNPLPSSVSIQYYLSGTDLNRRVDAVVSGATTTTITKVASNISSLSFTVDSYSAPKFLTIQVRASKTIYTNLVISFPLVQNVRLRNG